jgi:hypothetical protein
MAAMRDAISASRFDRFRRDFLDRQAAAAA